MTFPLGTSTRVEITSLLRYNIHFHFAAVTALLFDFGQPGETVRLRLVSCILMNHSTLTIVDLDRPMKNRSKNSVLQ